MKSHWIKIITIRTNIKAIEEIFVLNDQDYKIHIHHLFNPKVNNSENQVVKFEKSQNLILKECRFISRRSPRSDKDETAKTLLTKTYTILDRSA